MKNCAISTVHFQGLLKMVREMVSKNRMPIMGKTRYIANLPTARLVAVTPSTYPLSILFKRFLLDRGIRSLPSLGKAGFRTSRELWPPAA